MKLVNKLFLLVAFALMNAVFITSCSTSDYDEPITQASQKVAIIDAGSSGSRLHIYEISSSNAIRQVFPANEEETAASEGRALSSVANDPDSVRAYYDSMTNCYITTDTAHIPLYILATAGMRLEAQEKTEGVYAKLNAIGQSNGFVMKKATTISGRYEGLYAWIANNYKDGTLTASSKGIIEVGGASAQIAFATTSTTLPAENCIYRNGCGTIYSKSYLGGGINQVYANTPDVEPFNFTVPIEDVSAHYGSTTTFYGCGTPLNRAFTGISEKGSFDAYVASLKRTDKHHRYMFAYYMKWLFEKLHLEGKVIPVTGDIEWAEGAAYDILVNKEQPEEFDYNTKL